VVEDYKVVATIGSFDREYGYGLSKEEAEYLAGVVRTRLLDYVSGLTIKIERK
jgi:hypothetical protein